MGTNTKRQNRLIASQKPFATASYLVILLVVVADLVPGDDEEGVGLEVALLTERVLDLTRRVFEQRRVLRLPAGHNVKMAWSNWPIISGQIGRFGHVCPCLFSCVQCL